MDNKGITDLLSQDLAGKFFSTNDLKSIPFGNSGVSLRPIDFGLYMDDANLQMLQLMGDSERIKRFLPSLDFSSKEKIQQLILALCKKTEMGLEFAYGIYVNNAVVGMFFVNTPDYNKAIIGLPEWTMDFFIVEPLEGKGIMLTALQRMLYFLQSSIGVKSLYVLIDQDNTRCLNLIRGLPFDPKDNSGFKIPMNNYVAPLVFECPLSLIQFR